MDKRIIIISILILILVILLVINFLKSNEITSQKIYNESDIVSPIHTTNSSNEQLNTKSSNGDKLILYYTNWCSISKQFKPIWDEFCKKNKTNVKTIEINCENDINVCQLQKIKGYPTVILHKMNGEKIEFIQQRTVENINNFVNKYKSI